MMADNALDKHRHISFTAHYTSYVWYTLGLSPRQLVTPFGRVLGLALSPIERAAQRYLGGSVRQTLKQRHRLIDEALTQFLTQHPNAQVIEIASGLSPRGWYFQQHFPNIRYIEVDLPDMAALKQRVLTQLQSQVSVMAHNIFEPSFQLFLASLDSTRPLVIISEGLINYFSLALIEQLFGTISTALHAHVQHLYLTDLYPQPTGNRFAPLIQRSSKLLKYFSRSQFSFYFDTPQQVIQFAQQCGFKQVLVQQPSDASAQATAHLGDLVWVLQLRQS